MKGVLIGAMCGAMAASGCSLEEEEEIREARSVSEVQTQSVYTLTVNVIESGERPAGGEVQSFPAGIYCAIGPEGSCTATFAAGTSVSLLARAWPRNVFDGWVGCPSPSGPNCLVTMNGNVTVTAKFFCPPGKVCAI